MFVKDKLFYKSLFSMTVTIALQNVIIFGVNLADSIMLGSFSEQALSGVALVNQIQFLLQMVIIGVGAGTLIFSSRAWGSKDIDTVKKIANIAMKTGLFLSLVIFIPVFFFPQNVLSLLSNETAVVAEGVKYLRIICFTYPIFAATNVLLSTLRSVETVRIGFFVSLSTLIINVCLNYLLIFGNFGFPRLGAQGAAIATTVARIVELLIVSLYIKFGDKKIGLRLSDYGRMDKELFRTYLKKGTPVLCSNTMWGLAMAIQTSILGHLGQSTITAGSIASTVFQIFSVVVYGCANASGVLVSKMIGEGKKEGCKPYIKTLQIIYVSIGLVTSAFLFCIKDWILSFYDVSPEAKALTSRFLLILCVTVIGTSYQMSCLTGIVVSGGDTTFIMKNDFIFMWLIVLPMAAIFAFVLKLPPEFVFVALKADQILKCPVAFIKTNRYTWIKKL